MGKYLLFLFVPILCWSCVETASDSLPELTREMHTSSEDDTPDTTPYSMEIMQQAYAEIMSRSKSRSAAVELQPTHRYIKFLPRTSEQYQQLLDIEDFECTPFSILEDYELPEGQNYASCPETDGVGALYATVESAMILPENIDYEVVESYYTPYAENSGITDPALAEQVVQRAAQLTGGGIIGMTWYPSGTIKVQDKELQIAVPLQGVKVCVAEMGLGQIGIGKLPKTEVVTTDAKGYFVTKSSYDKNSRYYIQWQTDLWEIVDDHGNYVYAYGPSDVINKNWNITISSTSTMTYYRANIHRALNTTLQVEKLIPFGYKPVQIFCRDGADSNPYYYSYGMTPAGNPAEHTTIDIWCKNKAACLIVAAVNYQLGRFGLFENNRDGYSKLALIYRNSWGLFTRSYFTDREYMRTNSLNKLHEYTDKKVEFPDNFNMQEWRSEDQVGDSPIPIFIDVYDNFDQSKFNNFTLNGKRPVDKVCIPDFQMIKKIVYENNGFQNFKNTVRLYAERSGNTLSDVNVLFGGVYSKY